MKNTLKPTSPAESEVDTIFLFCKFKI